MALDTQPAIAPYDAPIKDLYEIGEMPPLGHVPKNMYAWAIRRERHGEPEQAMRVLLEMLGLERQGRQREVIEHRKTLRGLHSGLYAAYLATR